MADYPRRFEGTRWKLMYGCYEGPERTALLELQRNVQSFLPYVMEVKEGSKYSDSEDNLILLGTRLDNPVIDLLCSQGVIDIPIQPEGFAIRSTTLSETGRKIIAIAGSDSRGVLYGVYHFLAHVLSGLPFFDDPCDLRALLDGIGEVSVAEYPRIGSRGIWTWGYVIYDYRGFIDNMAKLRMNTLVVWNDCLPVNAAEIVDYAKSRGVRFIPGFHWGWDVPLDPNSEEDRARLKVHVLRNFEENYAPIGVDGIYFQTFTEHHELEMGGKSVAALACEWVNDIAGALLERHPGMEIQFGLHAISIRENYKDLAALDPRVTIVWEDAGMLPFDYNAATSMKEADNKIPEGIDTFEKTLDYSRELAVFRQTAPFAMVAKGWTKLRWHTEFEHHGPFILGERDAGFINGKLAAREQRWNYVNEVWFKHYPLAAQYYREIHGLSPAGMSVTALVEDGLFEAEIQPSVALFAETIWNPYRTDQEILSLAMSKYYRK